MVNTVLGRHLVYKYQSTLTTPQGFPQYHSTFSFRHKTPKSTRANGYPDQRLHPSISVTRCGHETMFWPMTQAKSSPVFSFSSLPPSLRIPRHLEFQGHYLVSPGQGQASGSKRLNRSACFFKVIRNNNVLNYFLLQERKLLSCLGTLILKIFVIHS